MSSSTRPSSAGSRSYHDVTRDRMCCQARATSAWSAHGQPSRWQVPFFQSSSRGTLGQVVSPSRSGLTACQMSMNGWPTMRTCWPSGDAAMPWAIAGLLGSRHQVVDEDPDPASRPRPEGGQLGGQVVDAAEVLDHDPLDAQVVAPHPLDQLGVVAALDEDPARPRHPGRRVVDGHRARRGAGRGGRRRRGPWPDEDHGAAVEQEAGPQWERAPLAAAVLQRHRAEVGVHLHDLAAPVGGHLLHHDAEVGGGLGRPAPCGRAPVTGQHIGAVPVAALGRRSHRGPR